LTLYASSNDDALAASKEINHYQRAGDTQGGVTIDPPVETIDASNVDTDLIGHSYFSGPMVISDIYYIFRTGASASNRARLQERGSGSKTYWIFTPAEHWWTW
jgi:esterase/lipase superfamily enzyme